MFVNGIQNNPNRTDPGYEAFYAISQPGYRYERFTLEYLRAAFRWEPRRLPAKPKKPHPKLWTGLAGYAGCTRVVESPTRAEAAKLLGGRAKRVRDRA